jgi:hypothetical protein
MHIVIEILKFLAQFTLQFLQFATATISLCCGCPGVLIALGTTFAAFLAVRETRRNTQAQVASALLDTYARDDMLQDTIRLQDWKRDHPDNFDTHFLQLRHASKAGRDADKARRHLAHYHQKAAVLVQHKLIDRALLEDVISKGQVEFAQEYVEPLEVAIAIPGYDPHWAYDALRELHDMPRRTKAPPSP